MSATSATSQSYYSSTALNEAVARKVRVGSESSISGVSQGALMRELLSMRDGVRVCSRLHAVVHEFRQAHQIGSNDVANRDEVIDAYNVGRAPAEQVPAITRLSTPATYAELRQGGRLLSPYPPLSTAELDSLCKEIRAALVWKSAS